MPIASSAARTSACSSGGGASDLGLPGPSLASATSRPSSRAASSSALQGSIRRSVGTACDSRGDARRRTFKRQNASRNKRDGGARGARGEVYQEAALMSGFGPVLGKGDAMWRALSVLRGDLICFLDADTEDFSPHFVTGLLAPLVCERGVSFVKAFYRRPLNEGAAA